MRKRIEQLQNQRMNGVRTLADGELYEAERKRREDLERKREESKLSGKGKRGAAAAAAMNIDKTEPKIRKVESVTGSDSAAASSASAAAAAGAGGGGGASTYQTLPPLDLSNLEGADLLSADEKKLCSELRLLPQHYFVVKERLIREAFLRGVLKPGQARQLFKIGTPPHNPHTTANR